MKVLWFILVCLMFLLAPCLDAEASYSCENDSSLCTDMMRYDREREKIRRADMKRKQCSCCSLYVRDKLEELDKKLRNREITYEHSKIFTEKWTDVERNELKLEIEELKAKREALDAELSSGCCAR